MLKVTSKKRKDDVFRYVMHNGATTPRTTLRHAIEKMPDDRRRQAMGKR